MDSKSKKLSKEERLALQLRENLRKRKEQARLKTTRIDQKNKEK